LNSNRQLGDPSICMESTFSTDTLERGIRDRPCKKSQINDDPRTYLVVLIQTEALTAQFLIG